MEEAIKAWKILPINPLRLPSMTDFPSHRKATFPTLDSKKKIPRKFTNHL